MAAVTFWTLSKKETVRPEVNAFDRLSDFLSLAITSQFLRDQASDSEEVERTSWNCLRIEEKNG